MFGLTKREQRWKAEQQAAEALLGLVSVVVQANAEVRIAEAEAEAQASKLEAEKLRAELARLKGE